MISVSIAYLVKDTYIERFNNKLIIFILKSKKSIGKPQHKFLASLIPSTSILYGAKQTIIFVVSTLFRLL